MLNRPQTPEPQTKKAILERPTRRSQEVREAYADPKTPAPRVRQAVQPKEVQPSAAAEARVAEMRTGAQADRTIPPSPPVPTNEVTGVGGLPSTEYYDDFPLPPPRRASQNGVEFSGERARCDHLSGKIIIVRTGEELADGTELVVTHTDRAWNRMDEMKPVETIVYRPGQPYPTRDELMPPKPQGKQDPWRDTYYLHCVDPVTGTAYTFYHSAITGMLAIEALISRIHHRRIAPDHQPLVRFTTTNAPARGGYPAYWFPSPKLVGWVLPDGTQIAA